MVSASNFVSVDKDLISDSVNAFLPKTVLIPLFENDSENGEVLVKEGDTVKEGEVIAKAKGIFVHSSIPGVVRTIEQAQYSNGKQGLCATIDLKGSFSFLGKKCAKQNWQNYEASTIQFLLKEAGVVNTFDKEIPIFHQLKKTVNYNNILVIRLFDKDPSLVTESFVSKKYLAQVLEGSGIIAKAFYAKTVVLAYSAGEKDSLKEDIDSLLEEKKPLLFMAATDVFTVAIDTKKYPSGTMHDIVQTVKKTYKSDLFSKLGKKDLFIDSITALNSYNAIVFGKPVVSTFVHVTGDCLNSAAVLNVRLGTLLEDVISQCGFFKRNLSKIVINGLLSGKAVSTLALPIGRTVKSVEFIPSGKSKFQHTKNCIRCGNCRKICPVLLWPGNLYRVAHLENLSNACLADKDAYKSVILCSECGLCNAVCPSRLPLSQTISLLKESYHEIQETE
ncbi:MAG: 4Fe-4S dicluster domain-containing protein [Treponema sp.]|nr:4Fe-4S dicluster domain-containing protein [Treponema sp.]